MRNTFPISVILPHDTSMAPGDATNDDPGRMRHMSLRSANADLETKRRGYPDLPNLS